jgi:hypothetical protein
MTGYPTPGGWVRREFRGKGNRTFREYSNGPNDNSPVQTKKDLRCDLCLAGLTHSTNLCIERRFRAL